MFRTTLTVLFAALTLSVPAFAQKGATGQDATQTKPLPVLKETEVTSEEVPVVAVLDRRAASPSKVVAEPIEVPAYEEEPALHEPLEEPAMGTTDSDGAGLELKLGLDAGILHADVYAKLPKFFGGVLLSLDNQVVDAGELGLTLLADAAVMGLGFGVDGHLALKVPAAKDLGGLEFYGQAVVADGYRIEAGAVVRAIAN